MSAFDNIITADMKTMFTEAINSLLGDEALVVPCRLVTVDTARIDCPNCIFDVSTGKSSNKYETNPPGPRPFFTGICPYCKGAGVIRINDEEDINLIVLWDSKDWVGWKGSAEMSRFPEAFVQTMSKVDTVTKLKRASELIVNTDTEQYEHHRFTRNGAPKYCGLGADSYVFFTWKLLS